MEAFIVSKKNKIKIKEKRLDRIDDIDTLCDEAINLVYYARSTIVNQVNVIQLMTYFSIGRWIVEVEQNGQSRAQYGKRLLKTLSSSLNAEFGKGFSEDVLSNCRKFYLAYKDRISDTLYRKFAIEKSDTGLHKLEEEQPFRLPFSHYLVLCRIEDNSARDFCEQEAISCNWSVRTLRRQYASAAYERLLLGSNKKNMKSNTKRERNHLIIKDPYVLEFVGLEDKAEYSETDLETRLIDHLQEFLLEMGKGFTFVGRQVRFTFDEDYFKVDLVLYNRLLKCFVLIDLKTDTLKHQDLGQMQMYVNYYDRYQKTGEENPTIGILLCSDKNDAMVELTLPKDTNVYASRYELYLPDKKLLQAKLRQWLDEEELSVNSIK